jgi:hypothetical protein
MLQKSSIEFNIIVLANLCIGYSQMIVGWLVIIKLTIIHGIW